MPDALPDVSQALTMAKRESIKLRRVDGDRNRLQSTDSLELWYDSHRGDSSIYARLGRMRYTGVLLHADNALEVDAQLDSHLTRILQVENADGLSIARTLADQTTLELPSLIVSASEPQLLAEATNLGAGTCLRAYVDDAPSLHAAVEQATEYDFLAIRFRDPTNIPLELVIASLQATDTVVVKEVDDEREIDDVVVALGVMEVGAEGVLYSPTTHARLDELKGRLDDALQPHIEIRTGVITRTRPVGMGYRSCVDLATLFSDTEGLLVGSTSQGGILCCPEVFFLPYMELRPFRVNAGAVHSYVYGFEDRTDYMTELKAGSSVMVVDQSGKARRAVVGRMKTEVRPLRLIEAEFGPGEAVNVLMQDDWHVRIFSDEAKPLNITELEPGDRVLGHVASPGRHVGIKVDEHIVET
ncbi:MAG: 3-dehydroquinate synthase [Myxococcales bacterium]|nr:3-dehydroquinate synthase [Myxococcales bacterium]MDD9967050.1 3-dehydroquinate synthase [Myxococcales bacterium]